MSEILIPVSPGELVDRMTILTIKSERITDPEKLEGVRAALSSLLVSFAKAFGREGQEKIWPLYERLKVANESVWDWEEQIREVLCSKSSEAAVAACARHLHLHNDERFHIKREIDALMKSDLVEEKSYL